MTSGPALFVMFRIFWRSYAVMALLACCGVGEPNAGVTSDAMPSAEGIPSERRSVRNSDAWAVVHEANRLLWGDVNVSANVPKAMQMFKQASGESQDGKDGSSPDSDAPADSADDDAGPRGAASYMLGELLLFGRYGTDGELEDGRSVWARGDDSGADGLVPAAGLIRGNTGAGARAQSDGNSESGNEIQLEEAGTVTARAVRFFNRSAHLGNASAHHMLAFLHASGHMGLRQNDGLSVLHDYFGALGGHTGSAMAMGYRHLHGRAVPKSCSAAQAYYELAANRALVELDLAGGPDAIAPLSESERLSPSVDLATLHRTERELVQYYQFSADKGDAMAQIALGRLSYHGIRGVRRDTARALDFFERAIAKGETAALGSAGHFYADGRGVNKNTSKARELFEKGAKDGHSGAQNGLGVMHARGEGGLPRDRAAATKYFKLASEHGNKDALYNMGVLLLRALRDRRRRQKRVRSGDADSPLAWAVPGSDGDSEAEGAVNFVKAFQYFSLAAQQGHTMSLFQLAQMNQHGLGTARSCPSATRLFKAVAERGSAIVEMRRALRAFLDGEYGVAAVLYGLAAHKGIEMAQSNAAWIYDAFVRASNSSSHALLMYQMAAEQGNVAANRKIGDFHFYGHSGLNVSFSKSAQFYRAAANLRCAQSMFNLGFMHQYGIGLPADFHLAKRYFDMAKQTHPEAYVPVRLALANLWLHQTMQRRFPSIDWPFAEFKWPEQLTLGLGDKAAHKLAQAIASSFFSKMGLVDSDNALITLLLALLLVLARLRGAARRRRNRRAAALEEARRFVTGGGVGGDAGAGLVHEHAE
eukprot:g1192.t1